MNAEGKDIISLAIGSPDMPPSEQTINKLCEVAKLPDAHGYQLTVGTPELREAMACFYKRWYDVDLDPKTAMNLSPESLVTMMLLSGLTDAWDGHFARKWNVNGFLTTFVCHCIN